MILAFPRTRQDEKTSGKRDEKKKGGTHLVIMKRDSGFEKFKDNGFTPWALNQCGGVNP